MDGAVHQPACRRALFMCVLGVGVFVFGAVCVYVCVCMCAGVCMYVRRGVYVCVQGCVCAEVHLGECVQLSVSAA
jgi:hypothetical protein